MLVDGNLVLSPLRGEVMVGGGRAAEYLDTFSPSHQCLSNYQKDINTGVTSKPPVSRFQETQLVKQEGKQHSTAIPSTDCEVTWMLLPCAMDKRSIRSVCEHAEIIITTGVLTAKPPSPGSTL